MPVARLLTSLYGSQVLRRSPSIPNFLAFQKWRQMWIPQVWSANLFIFFQDIHLRWQIVSKQGTSRFQRIKDSVLNGDVKPPIDLRYLKRGQLAGENSEKLTDVLSFLQSVYDSIAETLPDVRDATLDDDITSPSLPSEVDGDPYVLAMTSQTKEPEDKSKRKKRARRGVQINPERSSSDFEERYLPPGTMKEYFIQYCQRMTGCQKVTFPTFWRAPWQQHFQLHLFTPKVRESFVLRSTQEKVFAICWWCLEEFVSIWFFENLAKLLATLTLQAWSANFSFMKFRQQSSHSQCSECVRHKAIIGGLAHHIAARQMQQSLMYTHLKEQFADRVAYWTARGSSRSGGLEIVCIQDGMDQAKFMLPRSSFMRAKSFETFQRPKLHCAATLCHGHHLSMFLSEPDVPKDSNASCEQFMHSLNALANDGLDLSACSVVLQADNTSREVKNGIMMRLLAALTSDGLVASARLSHLRAGHSHEDIDQLFGQCAQYMKSKLRNAQSSSDVADCLRAFVNQCHRPFEKGRYVVKLDHCRDWQLGFDSVFPSVAVPFVVEYLAYILYKIYMFIKCIFVCLKSW